MTESVAISLENVYWTGGGHHSGARWPVYLWPVFFTIDGNTIQVTSAGITGMAAISGTSGTGELGQQLTPDNSIAIPPEIGQWAGELTPTPLPGSSTQPGVAGVVAVALSAEDIRADALVAGHLAFNSAGREALNEVIAHISLAQPIPSQSEIDMLISQVGAKVSDAIAADSALGGFFVQLLFTVNVLEFYTQDMIPSDPLDQVDFIQTISLDPYGSFSVSGAISQARRSVGQGQLSHFDASLQAVAGFADETYKHALVAWGNGDVTPVWDVTEIWWPGYGGPIGQGTIGQFSSPIVALAGFYSGDGFGHAIVGTHDRKVTEIWWRPASGSPGRGTLYTFESPIVALTGYYSGDGYNNVIVVTADNAVSQLWWRPYSGTVGQGGLGYVTSPVRGLAGYFADDGAHHVIVATEDRYVEQFSWSQSAGVTKTVLTHTDAWRSPLGAGAYDAPSDGEQHAIIGMGDGTVTEFHWSPANTGVVYHDDLFNLSGMNLISAFNDADGIQHAIVGTYSNDVHELWWTGSPVIQRPFPPLPGHSPPTHAP